jgi:hypothetical protein
MYLTWSLRLPTVKIENFDNLPRGKREEAMSEPSKKSYSVKHFKQLCDGCPELADDTILAPLLDIIWKNHVEKELVERRLSQFDVTDAFFLDRGGHLGHGQWVCVVNTLLIRLTPIVTDMDVVSNGHSIHMVWRIEAEGEEQRAGALLIKVVAFIKKYMAGKPFNVLREEGADMLRKYPPGILSKHVRRFYNLGG